MTKIKMLNDRIIFDGHADTRQECETITLMCDNLAKSKDFKTIRYESGYAEFEKVGKTEELKFPPYSQNVNFIFDSTISSILLTAGSTNTDNSLPATITESGGSSVRFGSAISGEPATTTTICTLTIADGYELDTINVTVSDESLGSASNFIISNKTSTGFTFYSSAEDTTWYTVTLTTKAIVQKQTIDVSTLSGWANLSTGNHQITIKTKASGYADSAASNAVTVAKAASGYTLHLVREEGLGADPRFLISYNGEDEFEVPYTTQDYVIENVTTINSLTVTIEMAPGYTGTIVSSELGISVPYNSTSAQSFPVITTATKLTQDTTITISTATAGHTVTFDDQESGGATGTAYYSLDDGATWTQFCAIISDANNDLSPTSLSNITSIKFKIEVNDLGLPPFGVKLVCSAIGMSLGGKNTGTFTSDNYTLTEDITVIITT